MFLFHKDTRVHTGITIFDWNTNRTIIELVIRIPLFISWKCKYKCFETMKLVNAWKMLFLQIYFRKRNRKYFKPDIEKINIFDSQFAFLPITKPKVV